MQRIKLLVIVALLFLNQPNFATESPASARIIGAWQLGSFRVTPPGEQARDFCAGATGLIIYEKSGYMSLAINCGENANDRVLFYSGKFSVHGNSVVHTVMNATPVALLKQEFTRKGQILGDKTLVLTGKLADKVTDLEIVWRKLAPNERMSTTETFGLLTYIKVRPGAEEDFIREVQTIKVPSRSEIGNIAWFVQQSETDSTEFVFYTRWLNEEALQWHLTSPPLADYITRTKPFMAEGFPKLVRFKPIDL